jgi:ABC-type transporter Mla subunit MlaD
VGNRVPDFSEAIAKLLGIVQPVATEATATLKELQNTSANLRKITDENSKLSQALGEFKTFGEHLNQITASDSSLQQSLNNIRNISDQLSKNDNIKVTLENFRASSKKLRSALDNIGPDLEATLQNAKDFTGTLKAQPWRLIWPSTKKYPNEQVSPAPVRRSTKVKRR